MYDVQQCSLKRDGRGMCDTSCASPFRRRCKTPRLLLHSARMTPRGRIATSGTRCRIPGTINTRLNTQLQEISRREKQNQLERVERDLHGHGACIDTVDSSLIAYLSIEATPGVAAARGVLRYIPTIHKRPRTRGVETIQWLCGSASRDTTAQQTSRIMYQAYGIRIQTAVDLLS